MRSLQDQQRAWLNEQLARGPRGVKSALAKALNVRPEAVTRMTNLDGGKETRDITIDDLITMAEFFGSEPPGLAGMRARSRRPDDASDRLAPKVSLVPLLDYVSAGKLTSPMSQIPVEDVPLLAFADLGRGEFFALRVDGDSMDRISPEGSVIVVNKSDRSLIPGKPYVFSRRGEATYKLWRPDPPRLTPYSINPAHEPLFVKTKREAEGMIVGRVKRSVLDL